MDSISMEEAIRISMLLRSQGGQAWELLKITAYRNGLSLSQTVMEFGDPRNWSDIPSML